jgi:hypothetical protein
MALFQNATPYFAADAKVAVLSWLFSKLYLQILIGTAVARPMFGGQPVRCRGMIGVRPDEAAHVGITNQKGDIKCPIA